MPNNKYCEKCNTPLEFLYIRTSIKGPDGFTHTGKNRSWKAIGQRCNYCKTIEIGTNKQLHGGKNSWAPMQVEERYELVPVDPLTKQYKYNWPTKSKD